MPSTSDADAAGERDFDMGGGAGTVSSSVKVRDLTVGSSEGSAACESE